MREHAIQAGMALRFERSPDYFALHDAHSPDHVTWVVTRHGRIVSIASAVVRPAYVDRRVRTAAYIADLRQARGRGLAGVWRTVAAAALDDVRKTFGATHAYCSILRGNRLARASILESTLGTELGFEHLRGYRTVTIAAKLPWPRARTRNRRFAVRHATAQDGEALRAFVDAQSRAQQFGPVFDAPTWQRRLEQWPGLGLERFLLATDESGAIVGCLAPWDASSINRIVVDALPRGAETLRRTVNALSLVTRRPKIPVGPGTQLPDVAFTHVFIADRNPDVLGALLACAYREVMRTRRYATLSLCLYDGDPLWAALRGMVYSTVPMDLYWLPLTHESEPVADNSLWPGFECYLV